MKEAGRKTSNEERRAERPSFVFPISYAINLTGGCRKVAVSLGNRVRIGKPVSVHGPPRRMEMVEEEIRAALREAAREGKISCAVAHKIAAEKEVSLKRVGELLNEMKIKVSECQLGCF